jgi:WD40 repeat protein
MSPSKLYRRSCPFVLVLFVATAIATFTSAAQEDSRPKLVIQSGHTRGLSDVAYSPDGSIVATAGQDGLNRNLHHWDTHAAFNCSASTNTPNATSTSGM